MLFGGHIFTTRRSDPRPVTSVRPSDLDRTRIGDQLQSEASRLAEWVLRQHGVPYEIVMAATSVEHAADDWTKLRCADARTVTVSVNTWDLTNGRGI